MKTSTLLGVAEHEASRQVTRLLDAAKSGYSRLVRSTSKAPAVTVQRRYIRAVEQTITRAEKTIAKLKKRIADSKKALGGTSRRAVKRKTRKAAARTGRKRAARKKRY